MVSLARQFVSRWFAGEVDRDDFALLLERADGSINSCQTELWDGQGRAIMDFLGRQRVPFGGKERLDGLTLGSRSFHRSTIGQYQSYFAPIGVWV